MQTQQFSMEILNDILKDKASKIQYFFTDVDGTLTDGRVYYSPSGELLKAFSLRDGTGFFLLKQVGIKTGIVTTEKSAIVEQRANKLNVNEYIYGTVHKKESVQIFLSKTGLSFENIAYIGDELNDIGLLKACGLSFAVGDADRRVKDVADIICLHNGGYGAFREAVEIILELKNISIDEIVEQRL